MFLLKSLQRTQIEKQEKLENRMSEIESTLNAMNEAEASKNVILYNVNENEESIKNILPKIQEIIVKAEVTIPDVCIVDVYRIGKKQDNKTRPVMIKLLAQRWKYSFFEKESKFKELGYSVSSDLSKEKRDVKKKLLKARYILKQEGKAAAIRNFKLYVENRCLTEKEIDNLILCNNTDNKGSNADSEGVEIESESTKTAVTEKNNINNFPMRNTRSNAAKSK